MLERFRALRPAQFEVVADDLLRKVEEGDLLGARMAAHALTSRKVRCESRDDRLRVIVATERVWHGIETASAADSYPETRVGDHLRGGTLAMRYFETDQFSKAVAEWDWTIKRHEGGMPWGIPRQVAPRLVAAIAQKRRAGSTVLCIDGGEALWILWQSYGSGGNEGVLRPLVVEGLRSVLEICQEADLTDEAAKVASRLASLGAGR